MAVQFALTMIQIQLVVGSDYVSTLVLCNPDTPPTKPGQTWAFCKVRTMRLFGNYAARRPPRWAEKISCGPLACFETYLWACCRHGAITDLGSRIPVFKLLGGEIRASPCKGACPIGIMEPVSSPAIRPHIGTRKAYQKRGAPFVDSAFLQMYERKPLEPFDPVLRCGGVLQPRY